MSLVRQCREKRDRTQIAALVRNPAIPGKVPGTCSEREIPSARAAQDFASHSVTPSRSFAGFSCAFDGLFLDGVLVLDSNNRDLELLAERADPLAQRADLGRVGPAAGRDQIHRGNLIRDQPELRLE